MLWRAAKLEPHAQSSLALVVSLVTLIDQWKDRAFNEVILLVVSVDECCPPETKCTAWRNVSYFSERCKG